MRRRSQIGDLKKQVPKEVTIKLEESVENEGTEKGLKQGLFNKQEVHKQYNFLNVWVFLKIIAGY